MTTMLNPPGPLWDPDDPDTAPYANPFDPNDQPDEWAAEEKQRAADLVEAARMRAAQRLATATDEALLRMRARRAAEDLHRAELAGDITVPAPTGLPDLLAEPDAPTVYRIDGLWPAGGNVVMAAAYKAGKTTTTGNLVRSLADGDPFLDTFDVTPVGDGTVGLVDFEMPRDRFRTWLRDQAIKNVDRVVTWPLRGQAATFDVVNPAVRTTWAHQFADRGVKVLIVDCLGPILSALGRDEDNKGVGPVLDGLTALAHEAGVAELLLVHHMGHHAERSRGASRLRDWPDAEWRIVRQRDPDNPTAEPSPNAPRFFSAFGRDVELGEGQLVYDARNRHLSYAEGNRRETRTRAAQMAVLEFVATRPGLSGRAIEAAVLGDPTAGDLTQVAIREALAAAVATSLIATVTGARRAKLHHITNPGRARLRALRGDSDTWPEEVDPALEPEPVDLEPVVACQRCYRPIQGQPGSVCAQCEGK